MTPAKPATSRAVRDAVEPISLLGFTELEATIYAWLVQHPGKAFGRALTVVDDRVIDGAVNEVAEDVIDASGVAPRIQRGFVRSYALAFLLGAVALLLFLGLRA